MRYLILVCAVVMQACLGATYSWSVYVQPLREWTGLAQGPVQIPFTVFYFVFPATMMAAGSLLPKLGPRKCAMAGGALFGGGWLVAGLGDTLGFWATIVGVGGLAGIGAGLAYIVPISVCIRWFFHSKGLVTGIAVAGFGGGAALVSQIGGMLMADGGYSPFGAFRLLGGVFLCLVVLAGSVMHFPRDMAREVPAGPAQWVPRDVLSNAGFRVLYLAMFLGLAAGFAVNANLRELYQGGGNAMGIGVTAVSLFALANAAGRVVWGAVCDRLSGPQVIPVNLMCQAVMLGLYPMLSGTAEGFWVLAALTGFNYGGVLVIYVSSSVRIWGPARISQVYGWLFTANIPASLSPILAGMVYDQFQTFTPALMGLAGMLILGATLVWRVRPCITPDGSS